MFQIRPKTVVTIGKEGVQTGVVGQLKALLHLTAFYLDNGFVSPFVVEENEPRQYLFGIVFPIAALAIKLFG